MEKIKISKLTYFDKVPTKYCENRRGKKSTFHESIQLNKNNLVKFFAKQPYYRDLMPTILKNNRGNAFYKKLIRKGIEFKSPFIRTIMEAIEKAVKDSLDKNSDKSRQKKLYKIPKLELLKKKKQKIEKYYKKNINKSADNDNNKSLKTSKTTLDIIRKNYLNKIKNIIHKNKNISSDSIKTNINNSTNNPINIINSTINNFNNNNNFNKTMTVDTFHTNEKNDTLINFNQTSSTNNIKQIPNTKVSRNSKITYTSIKKYFCNSNQKGKNIKTLQLDNILNRCNEDLSCAKNLGENVGKNKSNQYEQFVRRIGKRFTTIMKTNDQKVVEEKGKVNKKYQKKEKEKFKELKKKIDIKVSDEYAYINRKKINESLRDNETIFAYQIYLRDMHKFNKSLAKTKEIEKKNMTLVESLLEDTYRQKEFLKYKVDNYYIKHAKQDELNLFSFQNRNKDDYFLNKNNGNKLKGTLLPKLIKIKDYCYGRSKYNPIAEVEDNIKI